MRIRAFARIRAPGFWPCVLALAIAHAVITGASPVFVLATDEVLYADLFPLWKVVVVLEYMLSNPPFGVEWKKIEKEIRKEAEQLGFDGRFGPGLPRVSDGSLVEASASRRRASMLAGASSSSGQRRWNRGPALKWKQGGEPSGPTLAALNPGIASTSDATPPRRSCAPRGGASSTERAPASAPGHVRARGMTGGPGPGPCLRLPGILPA